MNKDLSKKLKLKKVVVKKLTARTGIKALGSNNSCTGAVCHTW